MLLCASKFATGKIECSFERGKETPLGVIFILLAMEHIIKKEIASQMPCEDNGLRKVFSRTDQSGAVFRHVLPSKP